jgi:hypothetical protein
VRQAKYDALMYSRPLAQYSADRPDSSVGLEPFRTREKELRDRSVKSAKNYQAGLPIANRAQEIHDLRYQLGSRVLGLAMLPGLVLGAALETGTIIYTDAVHHGTVTNTRVIPHTYRAGVFE